MPKHPILDRTQKLRDVATHLQLDCLDTVWLGCDAQYRFVCQNGHVVIQTASQLLKRRAGCRECKVDLLTDQLRAAARGAEVIWLDQRCLGSEARLRFRCQRGHTWERVGHVARKSCGCPQYGYEKRNDCGWAHLQQIAARRRVFDLRAGDDLRGLQLSMCAGPYVSNSGIARLEGRLVHDLWASERDGEGMEASAGNVSIARWYFACRWSSGGMTFAIVLVGSGA